MQPIDLENSFTYHPPTPEQIPKYEELRAAAKRFATKIAEIAPDGPEKTLAIRKVESAVMWANKAIACEKPPAPAPGPYLDGDFGDGVQPC